MKKEIFVAGSGEERVGEAHLMLRLRQLDKETLKKSQNCNKQLTVPHPSDSSSTVQDLAASSGRMQQTIEFLAGGEGLGRSLWLNSLHFLQDE